MQLPTCSSAGGKLPLRWQSSLGEELGKENVSPVAAPARLKDFNGLAPAYIEGGELDIFRDEAVAHCQHLALAKVPVELHVHSSSKLARAMKDRVRTLASI
jgi:acetyl esterase/lipase